MAAFEGGHSLCHRELAIFMLPAGEVMRDDDFDLRQHNYFADIMKMDFTPGTACHLTILHDDWCAIFDGGYCDCNPEIIRRPVEVGP